MKKVIISFITSFITVCTIVANFPMLSTHSSDHETALSPIFIQADAEFSGLRVILRKEKLPTPSSSAYFTFIAEKKVYSNSKGYVDPGDKCYIEKIDGANVYVKFPTSNGYVKRWFTTTNLLPVSLTGSYEVKIASDYVQAYSTSSLKTKFGRLYPKDRVFVLKETSSAVYVAMPLTDTGNKAYQLCWISKANADKYLKSESSSSSSYNTGSAYTQKVNAFLNNANWKLGTDWTFYDPTLKKKGTKSSPQYAWQCAAYAADFAKEVHGKNSIQSGTSYTYTTGGKGIDQVRAGDILHVYSWYWNNGKKKMFGDRNNMHWIIVVGVSNGKYDVLEANVSGGVSVRRTYYKWFDSSLGRYVLRLDFDSKSYNEYPLVEGFHY